MPTISATPHTAAILSAAAWGAVLWLAWPSTRLTAAVFLAAAVWAFTLTIRLLRG